MSRTKTTPDATQRRGFLRGLGLAAGAAAAATPAAAERSDTVPLGTARKENEAERKAPRYRETPHVQAFYRTNRF
ncbi:hypothetical protein GCM10009416_44660 [Craurococcus roseus]|uniref:Twin-arginine translocation signal domain-containing protein n=1 Tax=Craurococcus roseus TaxID=77585 RepID=A0ABN1G0T6_9PROT